MAKAMEYRGYHAQVEYDADDNLFVGHVLDIADSLNFHATSVDELTQTFRQSVDNYLELCAKIGKTPEKAYSGTFNVRVSPELHRRLSLEAAQEGVTLNKVVENALVAAVGFESKPCRAHRA